MEANRRIALVTDSGTNVPQSLIERYGIYCAYLTINYRDAQYREAIDIDIHEVSRRFSEEIPHTSTPSAREVSQLVDQAIRDGHDQIVCVATSSGLSSTCSLFQSVLVGHPEIESHVVDTKSIGAGGGMAVLYAAELIERGLPFDEICERVEQAVGKSHVYFLVDTLDNLYLGGRIGKAVYSLGTALHLKPVITCDAAGKYVVAAKTRGRKKALDKQLDLVRRNVEGAGRFRIGFASGLTPDRSELLARVRATFPNAESVRDFGDVSPALFVHTGPGMVGVTCQVLG